MMQIYADAISASQVGDVQYVLQNSLQIERTCKKKRVLKLLKSGWNIAGKFNNGVGYEIYRLDDKTKINTLINFLKSKFECPISEANIVNLSFQEFYDCGCQSEGINVDITFWNGKMQYDILKLEGEGVQDIRDFLMFHLFVKQDKDFLIDTLEKDLVIE